jgi:hypothetical protein
MSKNENPKYFMKKYEFCEHIEKLASGHQKNNFKNVTIIFYFFREKSSKFFYVSILWKLRK